MFIIRPKHFTFLILFLGVLQACRQELDSPDRYLQEEAVNRFFNEHGSADARVIAIKQNIERQESKKPFVEEFTQWAGFPLWNKARVLKASSSFSQRSIMSENKELVMIPFIKETGGYINAVLMASINGSDTSFKMFYHWQYADYGFDGRVDGSWKARNIFSLFASFEWEVFGRKALIVEDTNLVRSSHGYGKAVLSRRSNNSQDITDGRITIAVQECVLWDVCIPYLFAREAAARMNGNDLCYQEYQIEICTTYYYDLLGGQPGIGSGGSGGWNDNPCRNHPAGSGNPCGDAPPAWTPVPILDDVEPVDSLLARTSRAINTKADELIALAQANRHWEYVATIVRKDSLIYAKNERTDRDSTYSTPNLSLASGEILMGTIHTHSTTLPNDKSAPSHGDLYDLKRHLVKNYLSFVECGDVRYALVIEDVAKAAIYLKTKSLEYFFSNLIQIALQQPNAYSNWQKATEKALSVVLSPASTCGIGFYISNNAEKTSYTKANP